MPDGRSVMMRMGISDSVHHAATAAVDISYCVLLTTGTDAELFPRTPIRTSLCVWSASGS
jgi:hypothetical protein